MHVELPLNDICDHALSLLADKNELASLAEDSEDIFFKGLVASKADRIATIRSIKGKG